MKTSKIALDQIATYSPLNTFLAFSSGVSRGQETYGYSIARLHDSNTRQVFKCMGGGYDMHGTNAGEYLNQLVKENPLVSEALAKALVAYIKENNSIPYGLNLTDRESVKNKEGKMVASKVKAKILNKEFYFDGACGSDCIYTYLKLIGFKVETKYQKAKNSRSYSKFLGVDIAVNPKGVLAKLLLKDKLTKNS